MKKFLVVIMAGILLMLNQGAVQAKDFKMGYISLTKVFEGYKKVTDSNKNLEQSKEEIKKMLENMEKLKEGYDALSNEAKQERQTQMLAKQQEVRTLTAEVRQNEERILREILKDIEQVSAELRKKKSLDYVIDDRLVIDGPKDMDITDEVIKILNERYK